MTWHDMTSLFLSCSMHASWCTWLYFLIAGRFYFLNFMMLISLLCNICELRLRNSRLNPLATFHRANHFLFLEILHFKYSFWIQLKSFLVSYLTPSIFIDSFYYFSRPRSIGLFYTESIHSLKIFFSTQSIG